MSVAYLLCAEPTLGELIAALRRHDRDETLYRLERWAGGDRVGTWHDLDGEAPRWLELADYGACQDLDDWVLAQCRHHVAGGRFEHALCLVERYRSPDDEDPT